MQMYDVGMTGMFLMEVKALMAMAQIINRTDVIPTLQERYNTMSQLCQQHLWDESLGIFVNKLSDPEQFYPRLSPTNFYPMLSGMATDQQVGKEMLVNLTW